MTLRQELSEPEEPTLAEQIEAVEFAAGAPWGHRLTPDAKRKLTRWLHAAVETLRQVDRASAVLEALQE